MLKLKTGKVTAGTNIVKFCWIQLIDQSHRAVRWNLKQFFNSTSDFHSQIWVDSSSACLHHNDLLSTCDTVSLCIDLWIWRRSGVAWIWRRTLKDNNSLHFLTSIAVDIFLSESVPCNVKLSLTVILKKTITSPVITKKQQKTPKQRNGQMHSKMFILSSFRQLCNSCSAWHLCWLHPHPQLSFAQIAQIQH